jgi:predicted  nucleic acid-binding Zn-ribbon protein
MKQQVTRFEKSTPRQLAYTFFGIGLIGTALYIGGSSLGFSVDVPAAWIMLLGFVGATIFFIIMGGTPVPVGTSHVEVEDRVRVEVSDELEESIRSKVEHALEDMQQRNTEILARANEAAEAVASEITHLKEQLAEAEIEKVTNDLKMLSGTLDVESANQAINELRDSINAVNSNLGDMTELSTTEAQKLENTVSEVSENLNAIVAHLQDMDSEVQTTLEQFKKFNQMG